MIDIDESNIGVADESVVPATEKSNLDTIAQILSACIKEYPEITNKPDGLKITDYTGKYEESGRGVESPYISNAQGLGYSYFTVPVDKERNCATLGIPVFARGFLEKIQDQYNKNTYYIVYPLRDCKGIEILKFPFDMLRPFLQNDKLREQIVTGANSDNTEDLKKRFEIIKRVSEVLHK